MIPVVYAKLYREQLLSEDRALTRSDMICKVDEAASATVTGQTQLTNEQIGLLAATNNLALSQGNSPSQLAAAELNALIARLGTDNRRALLNQCIAQIIATTPAGSAPDISTCLP